MKMEILKQHFTNSFDFGSNFDLFLGFNQIHFYIFMSRKMNVLLRSISFSAVYIKGNLLD